MRLPREPEEVKRHRLIGDPEGMGDAAWFGRLNAFEQEETRRQAQFKRDHWPELHDGSWAGRPGYTYPHILPEGQDHLNLYAGTRDAVLSYLKEKDIAAHREFANLRSSQVCCLNFLFPWRTRLDAAAVALRPLLPDVVKVEKIEFEYTGPDGATDWLGEPPGGKRGQNRTSADAAVWWADTEGHSRLTLIEWKYTERQFGTCGGFASDGNKRKDRCRQRAEGAEPPWKCYLVSGDCSRTTREYWKRLGAAGIDLLPYEGDLCPFAGPFYQLMRLHLLAAYCAQQDAAREADFAAVHFARNSFLDTPPRELRHLGATVAEAWKRLLGRPDDLRVCNAESLATGIRASGAFPDLADYLAKRYGV